jgi:glucose uptake protein GlcU
VPSLLGIAFLGDEVKNGEWPLMVAGFIFVIVGTVLVSLGVKEANDQKHLATPKT